MFWHHDVGLSFPKSVGALIGGSADLFVGVLFGQEVLGDVKNRCDICLCYTLNAPKKHHIVDKSIIFKQNSSDEDN
jgi:hypothetical protein